jgi:hypothetical protein
MPLPLLAGSTQVYHTRAECATLASGKHSSQGKPEHHHLA